MRSDCDTDASMNPKPPPSAPTEYRGFRVGDLVVTPLGRIARITAFRVDSDYADAVYEGWPRTMAETILNVSMLKRVQ